MMNSQRNIKYILGDMVLITKKEYNEGWNNTMLEYSDGCVGVVTQTYLESCRVFVPDNKNLSEEQTCKLGWWYTNDSLSLCKISILPDELFQI